MSRKPSTLLEHPILKPEQEKKMPRKMNAVELKSRLKETKASARVAKQTMAAKQKEFVAAPDVASGKMFREATSQFIKAIMAQETVEGKMTD